MDDLDGLAKRVEGEVSLPYYFSFVLWGAITTSEGDQGVLIMVIIVAMATWLE